MSDWEVERSVSRGDGDPHFGGIFLIFTGIAFVCYGIYLLLKRIETYKFSQTNFKEYQKRVIAEEDALIKSSQSSSMPKAECPYCHSYNTSKISTTDKIIDTAMFGVLSQKRQYQWHCNSCKSDF